MPALAVLAVAASVLLALLFVADATLEKDGAPAIVTSQRSGLPEPRRRSDDVQVLISEPAPEPDMTSQAVLDAQPKAASEAVAKIHPDARAAHAEAPPANRPVMRPMYDQRRYQPTQLFDRFSIKDQ
ncbi:MAG TPA: hypothetical protein VH558_00775 [Pseudolabrys sp.]|jgi:hypothetical protein